METPRPSLARRIAANLRARQFLVFFAIALFALDMGASIASAWLRRHHGLASLLNDVSSPFDDLFATGSVAVAALVVVSTALAAWLRVVYIRALLGRERTTQGMAMQFWSMTALLFGSDAAASALGALALHAASVIVAQLAALATLAIVLVTLYSDYAIVISDVGPLASLRRSWATVRAAAPLSLGVFIALTVVDYSLFVLLGQAHGSAVRAAALLVIQVFATGSLHFVADVALITVYLDVVAAGRDDKAHRAGGTRRPPPAS